MASGQLISPIQLLTSGANPRYRDAFDRGYEVTKQRMGELMELDIPTDKNVENFPFMLAMPHIGAWPTGAAITEGSAASQSFQVVTRPYGLRVSAREQDVTLDQVKYLLTSIAQAGASAGWLDERLWAQIVTGATDPTLLPAIPNAADGGSIFSLTDGAGNPRFAVASSGGTGGNIVQGSGVSSVAQVINDMEGVYALAKRWQDGQGQPLWNDEVLEGAPAWVVAGAHLQLVMKQAMSQSFIFQDAGGNRAAAPTNLLQDASHKLKYWLTQRIPIGTNSWFVFLTGITRKAIAGTRATQLRYIYKTPETSDWCADYRTVLMQWDELKGAGVGPAYSCLKVSN